MEQTRKKELRDIAVCPLCGKLDDVYVTEDYTFDYIMEENGWSAVSIDCIGCHLGVRSLTKEVSNAYEDVRANVVDKWNKIRK